MPDQLASDSAGGVAEMPEVVRRDREERTPAATARDVHLFTAGEHGQRTTIAPKVTVCTVKARADGRAAPAAMVRTGARVAMVLHA